MPKNPLDYPVYLFKEGTNHEAYRLFRPSYVVYEGRKAWRFRCWAPNARSVSVVGAFNRWNRRACPMKPLGNGIWEGYQRGLKKFDIYKFSVEGADGKIRMKCDPFAVHAETPPGTASKVYEMTPYRWKDGAYFEKLQGRNHRESPLNIYELHIGSWKRYPDGNYYSYRALADELVPYLVEMGYTHVELLPITEFPFDGSWGYQVSGLFAPTSRFGTPHDFMYFVDTCHAAGIGVILDFVLSHFPKDELGLYRFDGTPLYEYADPRKGEHKGWGTCVFDYGKPEVRSFLISAAVYWFQVYHIDGMRLDAVASMLYLDYDRREGEWVPNEKGGNQNLEAISFLQDLNRTVLTRFPYAMMIAEESTAFPMVTMPPDIGGLGFNFKWNMGWMNDTLDYMRIDPFFRKGAHDKLTFSITYAFSENYVLPFSHDEVVHGKASMISKMPGGYEEKFQALKTLYAYQMLHPGKKLNFMGNELGQFIEWDYQKGLDWLLLDFNTHRDIQGFVKYLNHLYTAYPAMYQLDGTYDGFKWIIVDDNTQNVIAFLRADKEDNKILGIFNFADTERTEYRMGVPDAGKYRVLLDSNDPAYGADAQPLTTEAVPAHGYEQSVVLDLKGNQSMYLIHEED